MDSIRAPPEMDFEGPKLQMHDVRNKVHKNEMKILRLIHEEHMEVEKSN